MKETRTLLVGLTQADVLRLIGSSPGGGEVATIAEDHPALVLASPTERFEVSIFIERTDEEVIQRLENLAEGVGGSVIRHNLDAPRGSLS